ncbi:MAG: hypothetical protein HY658_00420 [Actinobacteria bacterium]|nr:hypothetical protein [Actinomycetota bacterium]
MVRGGAVAAVLAACWLASWAVGGAGVVPPHWFYMGIMLAATWFGWIGAIVAAVAAGLLAGPLLPLDRFLGAAQTASDWGGRLGFFVAIGLVMAWTVDRLRRAEHAAAEAHGRLSEAHLRLEENFMVLRRIDEERRRLLDRVVTAEEETRRRMALDLHDDSVQVVAAAILRMEALIGRHPGTEVAGGLDGVRRELRSALARLRAMMFELHPPTLDRDGLAAALRLHVERSAGPSETAIVVEDGLTREPPPKIRVIAYRIVLEALANIRKHAHATEALVILDEMDGGVRVRVVDDGVGFDPAALTEPNGDHLGLPSMRERAEMAGGSWSVESAPGRGTVVTIRLPLAAGTDAAAGSPAEVARSSLA